MSLSCSLARDDGRALNTSRLGMAHILSGAGDLSARLVNGKLADDDLLDRRGGFLDRY
jgi:hypothetical protein